MPNYVRGEGPLTGVKLMVIAEAPGAMEDQYGRPLIGPTGDLFDGLCESAGFSRDQLYVTNVVKYRPPNNDFSRLSEIGVDLREQTDRLWEEIRRVNPNCILALGDKALQATTGKSGIHNYRGSILRSKDGQYKVVSTFHPANLLYQKARTKGKGLFKYAWKYVMIADMKRAWEQAQFKQLNAPQHELKIARNSLDLFRFIDRHKYLEIAVADIESINCVPVCICLAYNKHEAISVPLYSTFAGQRISDSSSIDLAERWQLLAEELKRLKLIGQNLKYDDEKCYRLGLQFGSLYSDTLLMEHTLNPELPSKKLHVISSIRTEVPYYKEEGKEFRLGKDDIDQLFLYNAKDGVTEYEVHEDQHKELVELGELYSPKLVDFYYNFVVKLHAFYIDMERVGFKVNETKRKELNKKYTQWHLDIQKRIKELVGHEVNVFSPKQLFHTVYNEQNCPLRTNCSEDTLVQLMNNAISDEPRKEFLANVILDRRVRKSKGTSINASPDYDGRMRTSYYITGTETGRSTTQKLKQPVRPEPLCWSGHALPKHGKFGEVREMLVPDEGYVIVNMDLSQAEPRIVAVLCEDYDLLRAMESGTVDIHRRTAGIALDMIRTMELGPACSNPLVDQLDKDSGERFIGKKTRNGGNYNMGAETFHLNVMSDAKRFGIDVQFSEYRARLALDNFHAASPKVRGIFHRDIQQAIDKTRILVNPYGRMRIFMDRKGEGLYGEAYAWDPQSIVHDTLLSGGLRIRSADRTIRFISETHDAFATLIPKNEVESHCKLMKEKMEVPIDFNYGSIKRDFKLTLPVDFEVFEHDFKHGVKLKV